MPSANGGGAGLPDPSSMGLGGAGNNDKKQKNLKMAIVAVVAIVVLIIIIIVIVASVNSSATNKKKAETLNQYQVGYDEGVKEQKAISEKEFIEKTGKDFRIYQAPSEFGSFEIPIPKIWSLSLTPRPTEGTIIGLSDPDFVDTTVKTHTFIFEQKKGDYDRVIEDLAERAKKLGDKSKLSDVTVSGVAGKRYRGVFETKTNTEVELVVVPLREKYITFRTDNPGQYSGVFNNILNSVKLNP